MQRTGIFGGSFNPVHWGHLLIAETAREQANLEQVLWLPTYNPPHKVQDLAPFQHRYAMVSRAIAAHPAFVASDIEAYQDGTSYALVTVSKLQNLYPATEWFWILGIDAFQRLPNWQGDRRLVAQVTWLVAPRSSESSSTVGEQVAAQMANQGIGLRWQLLALAPIALSSSEIRDRCRTGESIRYRVPEVIRTYISEQKLYQMS
jgi:nicotinate-nucleotide adenylyltransferase